MRDTTETLDTAIESTAGVKYIIRAIVEPSRIYFSSITSNYPWSGADAAGILDEPTLQEVAYSTSESLLITFFNNSGTLSYTRQGNAAINSLSQSIDGKPGVADSTLYRIDSGSIYRHAITWATGPSLGSATNINTPSETPLVVHGISSTICATLLDDGGGLRPAVVSGTTLYECPTRFMFPTAIDYGDTRTMLSLATFSAAAKTGDNVFIYVSNCQKGWVEGVCWDSVNDTWSDIFIAIPTELLTSLCEFRIANAYTANDVIYISGQFNRTDSLDDVQPCTLICASEDGRTFSLDRFTLVSDAGYRFHAIVANNTLYLGNCNRVCYSPVTYVFNGNGTGHTSLSIPRGDIVSFSDSSMSKARLSIKAGDEAYAQNTYIISGSKVKVYIGCITTAESPEEDVLYNTYIIDEPNESMASGQREFELSLVNESQWKMAGLTMPFYAEILGKSSVYVKDTEEQSGNLSVATQTYKGETQFSIDFWQHQPYSEGDVTGIDMYFKGGVGPYTDDGDHSTGNGFRTAEIKTVLGLKDNPLVTGTITLNLYGWSRSDSEAYPTANDEVQLVICFTDEDGTNETFEEFDGGIYGAYHWPNTWPTELSGSWPISIDIPDHTGDRIKYLGMIWLSDHATVSYASRIDVTAGVQVQYDYDDPNTPWEFIENEGYRLPSTGRPYIMFLGSPYNAWNFQVSAEFGITVYSGVEGFPVSAGIIGLASDGSNYVCGRYDTRTSLFELVKCRDGVETVLDSAGATVIVGQVTPILLEHNNGLFRIYSRGGAATTWELQLEYEWQDTDGWMFTDEEVSPKCGIYGYISMPTFRIVGLDLTADDEEYDDYLTATAVGMLPLETVYYFPEEGEFKVGDDIYSYNGRTQVPYIRGPFQLRQNNTYSPPYGDGYGMEVTHFNWLAASDALYQSVIAIDAGQGWINISTLWQVWITTDGEVEYLRNRARYYSYHPAMASNKYSNSNRVYSTGGLRQIQAVSANTSKHTLGELATLYYEGDITCSWIAGASGEEDTTVADLAKRACALAGTSAIFPGDQTIASLIGPDTIGSHSYPDGCDIYFTAASTDIEILSNITLPNMGETQTHNIVSIDHQGSGEFLVSLIACTSEGGTRTTTETKPFSTSANSHGFRILYHDNFISVYMDKAWVVTFANEELTYPDTLSVELNSSVTITNVVYVELCDWREAVYIDLETDAQSALSSMIQERPVEVIPQSNGTVALYYDKNREEIAVPISPHSYRIRRPSALDAASDAIIYGILDVGTVRNLDLAEQVGFCTKVHRFSNLNRGAIRASKIIQQRKLESLETHEVTMRIDPSIEIGDIVNASFTSAGSGRSVTARFIAEDISINYDQKVMQITGRGNDI